jgi:hypothetical protein
MDQSLDCLNAEKSFLDYFNEEEHFFFGPRRHYKGADHPKVNFIRLLKKDISKLEFNQMILNNQGHFQNIGSQFVLKIPNSIKNDLKPDIKNNLQKVRTPITHLRLNLPLDLPENSDLNLIRVKTLNEFNDWKEVHQDARNRLGQPEDLVLYKTYENVFNQGYTHFYLLKDDDRTVSCMAITNFSMGKNIFGISTRKIDQKKGHIKSFLNKLIPIEGRRFWLQVNEGSPSYHLFKNIKGTKEYETETSYRPVTIH